MNELFKNITEKEQEKILNNIKSYTYNFNKNTIIPKDIINNNSICIIIQGTININKLEYNGNNQTIDILTTNNIFSPYFTPIQEDDYYLQTEEQTKITIINLETILNNELNNKYYHQLLKNIINIFSNKMLDINKRLEIISNKTIRNKLLSYFKQQAKKYNSTTIYLPFSYTNLANYLCIDRSAMNRELKHLKEEKQIEIKGKKIKINFYIN